MCPLKFVKKNLFKEGKRKYWLKNQNRLRIRNIQNVWSPHVDSWNFLVTTILTKFCTIFPSSLTTVLRLCCGRHRCLPFTLALIQMRWNVVEEELELTEALTFLCVRPLVFAFEQTTKSVQGAFNKRAHWQRFQLQKGEERGKELDTEAIVKHWSQRVFQLIKGLLVAALQGVLV